MKNEKTWFRLIPNYRNTNYTNYAVFNHIDVPSLSYPLTVSLNETHRSFDK